MDTHRLGRGFEAMAERALLESGFVVLERNVRWGRREIDLIVQRGETVAFVEVKGRRGEGCGHPFEAITALKRREIEAVARWWAARRGPPGAVYRFDAVAVTRTSGGRWCVEHLPDAWRPGSWIAPA